MKKIIAILLVVMMVMSLAACDTGSKIGDIGNVINNFTPTTAGGDTTPAPTNSPSNQDKPPVSTGFNELVLVDDANCTFKVTNIIPDGDWGYTVKVFMENKTDKELTFSWDDVSVNGFMCDPYWANSVTAGMKSNGEVTFYSDDFELNGITTVTDITLTLDVYDSNDWSADHLVTDEYTIYPYGEDAVTPYVREASPSDIVLVDNEYCTVIVTDFDPDYYWGYGMSLYLENKTSEKLTFSIDDAGVNGFMCDPYWADTVAAGKRCYSVVSWDEDDFEENSITTVESLTLPFTVYYTDDWSADYLVEETFTVNP